MYDICNLIFRFYPNLNSSSTLLQVAHALTWGDGSADGGGTETRISPNLFNFGEIIICSKTKCAIEDDNVQNISKDILNQLMAKINDAS